MGFSFPTIGHPDVAITSPSSDRRPSCALISRLIVRLGMMISASVTSNEAISLKTDIIFDIDRAGGQNSVSEVLRGHSLH